MAKKFITYNGTIVGDSGLTLLSVETSEPTPNPFTNTLSTTFDGVDDYITLANRTQLFTDFSVSAWFIAISGGSYKAIFGNSSASGGYLFGIVNGGRSEYWKLIIWTLFNRPSLVVDAITLTVYGYHYRTVFGLQHNKRYIK